MVLFQSIFAVNSVKIALVVSILFLTDLQCHAKSIGGSIEEDRFNSEMLSNYPLESELENGEKVTNETTNGLYGSTYKSEEGIQTNPRTKRYTANGLKWSKAHLSWRLVNKKLEKLDAYGVRQLFGEAFDKWARVSTLTFEEFNSTAADIQISFESLRGGSYFIPDEPKINGNYCYPKFNENKKWILSERDGNEGTLLMPMALYVAGRALGLRDSPIKGSIMYSRYTNPLPQELHEDDIKGIQHLYGSCTDLCQEKTIEFVGLDKFHITTPTVRPITSAPTHATSAIPSTTTTTTTTTQASVTTTTTIEPLTSTTIAQTPTIGLATTSATATTTASIKTAPNATTDSVNEKSIKSFPLNARSETEELKKQPSRNTQEIVITLEGVNLSGNKWSNGLDSIIVKGKTIIDTKNVANDSNGSPMILCILSKCQF